MHFFNIAHKKLKVFSCSRIFSFGLYKITTDLVTNNPFLLQHSCKTFTTTVYYFEQLKKKRGDYEPTTLD